MAKKSANQTNQEYPKKRQRSDMRTTLTPPNTSVTPIEGTSDCANQKKRQMRGWNWTEYVWIEVGNHRASDVLVS